MPKGLKTTFLVHAIVALVFGAALYVKPAIWAAIVNWTRLDAAMTRAFGAALLALAVSSWFAYRATKWEEVRIIVQTEIAFTLLGVVAGLYSVLWGGAPAFAWVATIIWAAFAGAWLYFFNQAKA